MSEQPYGHVVLPDRQDPDGFAASNDVFGNAGDDILAKEAVLLRSMIGDATILECLRVDGTEFEPDTLPDNDWRPKCQAIDIAKPLRAYSQPVGLVAKRFERLNLNRPVRGDAVITWV